MFKNKMVNIIFLIMIFFIVIGGGFFLYDHFTSAKGSTSHLNSNQIATDLTVDTDEMTTNLKTDNHFIKIKFKIQVSTKAAKSDLNKRMFQVKNAIIYQLSGMEPNQLQGPKGLSLLETSLKDRFNRILGNGKVTKVYITDILIQ